MTVLIVHTKPNYYCRLKNLGGTILLEIWAIITVVCNYKPQARKEVQLTPTRTLSLVYLSRVIKVLRGMVHFNITLGV